MFRCLKCCLFFNFFHFFCCCYRCNMGNMLNEDANLLMLVANSIKRFFFCYHFYFAMGFGISTKEKKKATKIHGHHS